ARARGPAGQLHQRRDAHPQQGWLQLGQLPREGRRAERFQAHHLRLRPACRLPQHHQGRARPSRLPGLPRGEPAAQESHARRAARRRLAHRARLRGVPHAGELDCARDALYAHQRAVAAGHRSHLPPRGGNPA
ncbi:MAG: hypothetical protein RIR83_1346, partial [Pseudomonadota bacterium]